MHPSKTACNLADAVASEVGSAFNSRASWKVGTGKNDPKNWDYYEVAQSATTISTAAPTPIEAPPPVPTLTKTALVSPSGCSSSRRDCRYAIDGDEATYSWITRSGSKGPQLLTLNLPSEKEISGVEIVTSGMLGTSGSSTCLTVGFQVGGQQVAGVETDLPGAQVTDDPGYELTQFKPKGSTASIRWNSVSGSTVDLTFKNCDDGRFEHWPMVEVRVITMDACTFQKTPNAAISDHNTLRLRGVSFEECKKQCCEKSWCRSFDMFQGKDACNLSDAVASEVGSAFKTGVKYDYYEVAQ